MQEMPETETVASSLLDDLSDGVVLVGADWRVRFINRRAERLLGYPREKVLGRSILSELAEPATARTAVYRQVMETRVPQTIRDVKPEHTGLEGKVFDLEVHPAASGGIAVAFREVTERANLEQRAKDAAAASVQSRTEFLAAVSHELRTPINAILGYVDLLSVGIGGPVTEVQQGHLARVRSSGHHLLELVDEILNLSQAERGLLSVGHEAVSIEDALSDIVAEARELAERGEVTFQYEPRQAGAGGYRGDPARVRQILRNLVSNAMNFTEPGGEVSLRYDVTGEVEPQASLAVAAQWLRVDVEDSGIGMSSQQVEAAFTPFARAEAGYTRETDGVGIGLALSRRLARLMEGDLTVNSRLGAGSCFTLWLPTAEAEGAQDLALAGSERSLSKIGQVVNRTAGEAVLEFCKRMRNDPQIPTDFVQDSSQLEDHYQTLLSDVGLSLASMNDGLNLGIGMLRDGMAIHRVISQCHGAQRARLGWTEPAMKREFEILRSAVADTVAAETELTTDDTAALRVVDAILEHSQRISVAGLRAESAAQR